MKYYHVDVFTSAPLAGNGLTVVFPEKQLEDSVMLNITQEFRQFETIFVYPEKDGCYPVRIFTVEEELDFAGHPMLGAVAVIHSKFHADELETQVVLRSGRRKIQLKSAISGDNFNVSMNQGCADFIRSLEKSDLTEILSASSLQQEDLHPDYPVEVVSTGLPYLLLPVKDALDKINICRSGIEELIAAYDAKFVYYFEPQTLECRTWDNAGLVGDVATGSAAGPLCAYLVKLGFKAADNEIIISQGRFTGRPSSISGWVSSGSNEVFIQGSAAFFAEGVVLND